MCGGGGGRASILLDMVSSISTEDGGCLVEECLDHKK